MEKQFPTVCPHGMLAHYVKPPWKLVVKKEKSQSASYLKMQGVEIIGRK
jgi:hypothetical protein